MLQMVDEKGLPAGVITDEPRFAYRGFMMDVSRHFFDKEFIKKQMDALAYYKLNLCICILLTLRAGVLK